ncbi:hypothetical protein ACFQO4_20660 [Saliphagus sp. GCM10025334]
MDSIIADEHDFIRKRLEESAASTETLLSVRKRLQAIGPDLRRVYDTNGYTNFLVAYLKREHEKYQLHHGNGPNNHEYDETRPTPTCHCTVASCPIGNGRLPIAIRTANDPERATRQYTHEHTAHPVALHEAREGWHSLCSSLESELSLMKIALAKDVPVETLEDPEALAAEEAEEETDDVDADDGEESDEETGGHDPTTVMA